MLHWLGWDGLGSLAVGHPYTRILPLAAAQSELIRIQWYPCLLAAAGVEGTEYKQGT